MSKRLTLVGLFLGAFLLTGCSLKKPPSALQINTTPPANVFIDGKLLGKTPYQANDLKAGEITVKLIPESTTEPLVYWEEKVKLNPGVLTLIEQDFAATEEALSGQTLTLEKIKEKDAASLSVISDPDGALVSLDGETKGFAPLALDQVSVGDHQITISKEGYEERTIKAKAIVGYRLIASVKLAQEDSSASPSGSSSEEAGGSSSSGGESPQKVKIKSTPTGWLRVRKGPSMVEPEVAKVDPGEEFELLGEDSGWYKIKIDKETEGWISGQYAQKL